MLQVTQGGGTRQSRVPPPGRTSARRSRTLHRSVRARQNRLAHRRVGRRHQPREDQADATEKYTADRLAWIEDWYIREPNYARALATIVKLQGGIPLASRWGSGRGSSSDGQAFPIAFRKPVIAHVNAKYGRDPVATFYTHVSDQYAPFHVRAISSTVRDATHVLDGLLNHQTDLQIEEHYTDTSGYTAHIFALCHLLGFRFAPRIRDLSDHRMFSFEKPAQYDSIKPLWADAFMSGQSARTGTKSLGSLRQSARE